MQPQEQLRFNVLDVFLFLAFGGVLLSLFLTVPTAYRNWEALPGFTSELRFSNGVPNVVPVRIYVLSDGNFVKQDQMEFVGKALVAQLLVLVFFVVYYLVVIHRNQRRRSVGAPVVCLPLTTAIFKLLLFLLACVGGVVVVALLYLIASSMETGPPASLLAILFCAVVFVVIRFQRADEQRNS